MHRVRGELGGEPAAAEYDLELEGVTLGLALQGLGPDGHTASLFPGSPALEERERRAIAVPHDDVERVTMTLPMLSGASQVVFLVVGAGEGRGGRARVREPAGPGHSGQPPALGGRRDDRAARSRGRRQA